MKTSDKWISIPNTRKTSVSGYDVSKTPEEREKEKLKYWSWFFAKKNRIGASSCRW